MKAFQIIMATCLCSAAAQADIIPILSTVTPSGSNWDWNYRIYLTPEQNVRTGDYLTIFDFGTVLAVSPIAGWSNTVQLTGTIAPFTNPSDDPTLLNVTWQRTGGLIYGPEELGIFTVTSASNQALSDFFTALGTRNSGSLAGTGLSNLGFVAVPDIQQSGSGDPIPEPGSLLMMGSGLMLVGLLRRRIIT